MKKRIVSFLLAFLMMVSMCPTPIYAVDEQDFCPWCEAVLAEDGTVVHDEFCNAEYAYDGDADVDKYVVLSDFSAAYGVSVSADPVSDPDGLMFYAEEFGENTVMQITDWYWDAGSTALWYRVKLYSGAFPESTEEYTWPETPWVFQIYTDRWAETDLALTFVTPEIPEEPEIPEPACPVCGQPGCEMQHIICQICGAENCEQDHLYCIACGELACTRTHVWCGTCGSFDCGIVHEDIYTPAVEPVIPENPTLTGGADVSVVDAAGNPVTEGGICLQAGTKYSFSAWREFDEAENVTYQWQIRYDSENDLWADIQGQTGKGILISAAMVQSILELDGSAAIRCVVTSGYRTRTGDAIPVEVGGVSLFAESRILSMNSGSPLSLMAEEPIADGEDAVTPGEKVYVAVTYEYSDGRTAAATDFAEIVPGQAYQHNYTLPVIPGYKSELQVNSFGESVKLENGVLKMDFAAGVLTDEYTTFKVIYSPDYVEYTVVHYWQNVDNDNYTEHEREKKTDKETGEVITDVHKDYPGFYNLLYETPAAAADGSTVIEVYYERYYYLMKFDLGDMGYGVDPIYARYGAEIEIGTPTRAGYIFQGWRLNGTGNIIEPEYMPTTMPHEDREYVAVWEPVPLANVSVVFWGENADDEGYSYIKTEQIKIKPGETISWDSLKYTCGQTAHSHSVANGCYELTCTIEAHSHENCARACGMELHTHSDSCCTKKDEVHALGTDCYSDVGNRQTLYYAPDNPVNGQIYRRNNVNRYIYINGSWYSYSGSTSGGQIAPTICNGVHSHNDHTCVCNLPEHTAHTDSCYDCGKTATSHQHSVNNNCYQLICTQPAHTHNAGCEKDDDSMDSNLWTFVHSDTVTVAPDGSTVLNVYYDRTTFTLTFRANYSTVYTIKEKWGASIREHWPIHGTNGTVYDGGERWDPDGSKTYEEVLVHLDIMPAESFTLTLSTSSQDTYIMHYMVETVPGESGSSYTYNNATKQFKEAFKVEANYNYITEAEDFFPLNGFTKWTSNPRFSSGKIDIRNGGDVYFYYTRNSYDLVFNDGYNDERTESVQFEAPLGAYSNYAPEVPDAYEAGTRVFAGWYLNPQCTGEQYVLSEHTMPAENMILYAKWDPVEYTVNYYLTRESLDRGETIPAEMNRLVQEAQAAGKPVPSENPYTVAFEEDIVKHGKYIVDPSDPGVHDGYEDIHPRTGYTFVGWFYLNEDGEETAFDPGNLPVTQDLNLYGKWSSNTMCQYHVYFALDENGDGVVDRDSNGEIIYVADPISGSGLAGRTYTFTAKGGDDLYSTYRTGYFPTVGSHSLVLDIKDEAGTKENSFIFLYTKRAAMPYTVKYLEVGTNEVLYTEKVVSNNEKVVVTENFVPISGYMPDAYQKTLVVTDGGVNKIIFYYTKDEQHAMYVVNYYIEDLNADLTHKGWSKYTDLQNTGVIGEAYSGSAITMDGFTLSKTETDKYNVTQKKNGLTGAGLPAQVGALSDDGTLSGTLTKNGLELNFYYTRNLYPYEFRYTLINTPTQLAEPTVGKAGYGMTVTAPAKEIEMDLDGDGVPEDYRLYDPAETSKSISIKKDGDPLDPTDTVAAGQATINVATFFYVRCTQTMTVTKKVVDNSADSDPDPNQEFSFTVQIHARDGFHKKNYDYRLSDGTTGTLTPVLNKLSFTLKANQTITIEGLPTAEYTVAELNPPSGYYDSYYPSVRNKLTVDQQLDVTVTNTYEPAVLKISKTVNVVEDNSNVPEVSDFAFTVAGLSGVAGTISYRVGTENRTATVEDDGSFGITLKNGQTAVFDNLPLGDYTVTENDYSAQGYDSNYKVTGMTDFMEGETASVTLARGTTRNVEFKNKFPVGDLSIEKTVTKEFSGTPWSGDTFTFTVERTTDDRPLLKDNKYDVYEGENKLCTCTVQENGTLQVEITFDAEALNSAASAVHTIVIKNLPAGTYSVTEAEYSDYQQSARTVSGLVLPAQQAQTAKFTNTLKRPTGSLSLTKELVKAEGYTGTLDENMNFSFTLTLLEEPPASVEVSVNGSEQDLINGKLVFGLNANETVTIEGIPIGAYRITEATVPQYANDFAHFINGAWVVENTGTTVDGSLFTEIAVKKGETAQVKCTNTFPVDRAELIIQKLVTAEYDRDTLPEDAFEFTVTLEKEDRTEYAYKVYGSDKNPVREDKAAVTEKKFTITLTDGQYAVIPQMPVCGYTVTETFNGDAYNTSYAVYLSDTGKTPSVSVDTANSVDSGTGTSVSRTFSAGKTDAVVFTNEYKRHLGTLTITKVIKDEPSEPGEFIFRITGNGVDMDVVIEGEGSVTIHDLPLGTYTVTEDTQWSWRYDLKNNAGRSATITVEDTSATVTFTNVCKTENPWLNFFTSVKNIFKKEGTP